MGCCSQKCLFAYNFTISILGIFAGLLAFFVFNFYYHNYHAGCWGLTSFLLSATNLHVNLLQLKNRMSEIHTETSLKIISITGLIVAVGATFAMATYIGVSVAEKIPIMPADKSLIMGATQSFLSLKYGYSLAFCSWKYSQDLTVRYGQMG